MVALFLLFIPCCCVMVALMYIPALSSHLSYMYTKKGLPLVESPFSESCDSHGARTHDPNIKSVVLYLLS